MADEKVKQGEQKLSKGDRNRYYQESALLVLMKELAEYNKFPQTKTAGERSPLVSKCFAYSNNAAAQTVTVQGTGSVDKASTGTVSMRKLSDLSIGAAPFDILRCYNWEIKKRQLKLTDSEMFTEAEVIEFYSSLTNFHWTHMMPYVTFYKIWEGGGYNKETCGYKLNLHMANFDQKDKSSQLGNAERLKNFFGGSQEAIGGHGLTKINLQQTTSTTSNYSFNKYLVSMDFIFNSLEDLVRQKYYDDNGREYRMAQLLMGLESQIKKDNQNPYTYLAVLEMGYTLDEGIARSLFAGTKFETKASSIVKYTGLKLFLQLTGQEMNLEENGKVGVTLNFTGWSETQQAQEVANILYTNKDDPYFVSMKDPSGGWKDETGEFEDDLALKRVQVRSRVARYQRFVRDLFSGGRIMFAWTDAKRLNTVQASIVAAVRRHAAKRKMMQAFGDAPSFKTAAQLAKSTPDTPVIVKEYDKTFDPVTDNEANIGYALRNKLTEKNLRSNTSKAYVHKFVNATDTSVSKDEFEALTGGVSGNITKIPYFYFSDIVQVATMMFFENLKDTYYADHQVSFEIDFGEIRILHPTQPVKADGTPNYTFVNIADIPISYDLFTVWFNREIVKPRLEVFTFHDFLTSVVNNLAVYILNNSDFVNWKDILKEIGANDGTGNDQYKISVFSHMDLSDRSSGFVGPIRDLDNLKFLKCYIYVYYQEDGEKSLSKKMTGTRTGDEANGIPWFIAGSDKGIIRHMKFKKNTSSALRSSMVVKAEQAREANADKEYTPGQHMSQLREFYDVTITTAGNVWLMPGQAICVQPSILGMGDVFDPNNEIVNMIGIGGYYYIYALDLSWQNNTFTSEFKARYAGLPASRLPQALVGNAAANAALNAAIGSVGGVVPAQTLGIGGR